MKDPSISPSSATSTRTRWLWVVTLGLILLATVSLRFSRFQSSSEKQIRQVASGSFSESTGPKSGLTNDRDPIRLDRIAAVPFQELYDLLAKRSPAEIVALARRLQVLSTGAIADARITAFYKAWAAVDPKAAGKFALVLPSPEARSAAVAAIIEGADAKSVGDFIKQLLAAPPNTLFLLERDRILNKGVLKWSLADPAAATAILSEIYPNASEQLSHVSQHPFPGEMMMTFGEVAQNWGAADPQAALAWALQASGDQKSLLLQSVIAGWWQTDSAAAQAWVSAHADTLTGQQAAGSLADRIAAQDPEAALRWAAQLPPEAQAHARTSVASGWARSDPEAAANWALDLPTDEREGTMQVITMVWALRDPDAAAQWIGSLDGEARDVAAGSYGSTVALKDPAAGLSWVVTISDRDKRNQIMGPIVNNWLQADPTAARAWIQNSALSPEEKARLLGPPPTP